MLQVINELNSIIKNIPAKYRTTILQYAKSIKSRADKGELSDTEYLEKTPGMTDSIVKESKIDDYDKNRIFEMTLHYYTCEVIGQRDAQNLDVYERALGFEPKWIDIDEAIALNEKFIDKNPNKNDWTMRETLVLKSIKELI